MRYFMNSLGIAAFFWASASIGAPLYLDKNASLESRVQDLLPRLTLKEKISLMSGDETGFNTKAIPRLSIPAIHMTDGPVGVRFGQATAFPSGISYGATFNPSLMREVAKAMGIETRALGFDMLLGPCIDISRNPFGGRNFESFGEDPYLTSRIAEAYVEGLQGEGVLASTKHYAMNDQEHKRFTINVVADERTMHEIHLPAFEAAVTAGTWSVMAAYNKINGFHATENAYLLNDVLKNKWGFRGFVVSDWVSVHSTVAAANNGLDLEMPTPDFFDDKLVSAVKKGHVSEATINDHVARILRANIGSGLFDSAKERKKNPSLVSNPANLAVALEAAEQSIVLLKNEADSAGQKLLPLPEKNMKIALLGPGAFHPRSSGGGSSLVNPTREPSPLRVLQARLPNSKIQYSAGGVVMGGDFTPIPAELWTVAARSSEHGIKGEYFSNRNLEGRPAVTRIDPTINFDWGWNPPANGVPMENFSIRWTGYLHPRESGPMRFLVRSDDGARLFVDDKLIYDDWTNHGDRTVDVPFTVDAGRTYKVRMEYYDGGDTAIAGLGFSLEKDSGLKDAVALAAKSDVAIIFAGMSRAYEGEELDRKTMKLPDGQDELIREVVKVNPNTIVVINGGNPVEMPWINTVRAVAYAWYPGQEGAEATVNTLLGISNPSGKLPVSFPKRWEDAAAYGHYPEDPENSEEVTYAEGIYVGYRHFDSKNVEPLFPFGHGLSYTNFAYSGMRTSRLDSGEVVVEFTLKNTGSRAGAEVAQLYVRPLKPSVDRPFQELKSFSRVELAPGESRQVVFYLPPRAFAYYSAEKHDWQLDSGDYELRVGASSRDIRLMETVAK